MFDLRTISVWWSVKFQFIEQLEKLEVSVVKKMSINLDIFFCIKLLKSIFNLLMLILGLPNLMKI